ncbi:uncharacterized protein METZ01_LOCUS219254 [marine metagenome]|uniref:Uncharacterized protein n=1 Tax=marine metagenome TaxID=408172 RepID=A0A382FTU5_9ZZZZ
MLTLLIIAISSYLIGGIPTGYLAVKYKRNISSLTFGTGNIGASNVTALAGFKYGMMVGAFDCLVKGALPIIICQLLGQPTYVQAITGIGCVIGHNWSPYMKARGGRGVATSIGILIAFQMWLSLIIFIILIGVIGKLLFKDTAFWVLTSFIALPFTTLAVHSEPLTYTCLFLLLILILKRITGNWENPRNNNQLHSTLFNRILFDRDIGSKKDWEIKTGL